MMKRKEIGSEYWEADSVTEPVSRTESEFAARKTYLSGRTALAAIISDLQRRHIKSVCIPDYCCESMIEPFLRQGMDLTFYPVNKNDEGLTISVEEAFDSDAVLLVDYFGFMSSEIRAAIQKCHEAGKVIILDNTHAVLSDAKGLSVDYIFGSYRKWTGIEAGFVEICHQGVLPTWQLNEQGSRYLMLRKEARKVKSLFVEDGYSNEELRKEQLSLFEKAEELLDREYISDTDKENKARLGLMNARFIKDRRQKNAGIIYTNFPQLKICKPLFSEMSDEVVPLTVPIMVPENRRDSLRNYLRKRGVFCPVHWPVSNMHRVGNKAIQIYREELSLVCDQRYDGSDMTRMMEMVKQWELSTSE